MMTQESMRTLSLETGEFPAMLALLRQPVVMDRKDMVPFIPSAPWAVANHFAGSILKEEGVFSEMYKAVLIDRKPIPQALEDVVKGVLQQL
jgi:hypothetical protein